MSIALWCSLAANVLLAATALFTIYVLGAFGTGIAPVERLKLADTMNALSGLIFSVSFVVAGIMVLRWVYITNHNEQVVSGIRQLSLVQQVTLVFGDGEPA